MDNVIKLTSVLLNVVAACDSGYMEILISLWLVVGMIAASKAQHGQVVPVWLPAVASRTRPCTAREEALDLASASRCKLRRR